MPTHITMNTAQVTPTLDLRQVILDESRHILTAHGYDSLSMRKIAKRIGYSATAIYLHFENKESLFHALIEDGLEQMFTYLQAAIADKSDPVAKLETLCRSYIDFGLSNPEYYEVMFVMKPVMSHRFPQSKYRRGRRNLDLFSVTLRAVCGRPADSLDSFAERATRIWASLHGVVSLSIAARFDRRISLDSLIADTVRTVVSSATVSTSSLGKLSTG